MCHTLGFGAPFLPEEAIKWLEIAAKGRNQSARSALPRFMETFNPELRDYVIPSLEDEVAGLGFDSLVVES